MASTTPTNGSNPVESKTAKKRKAKAEATAATSSTEDSAITLPQDSLKPSISGEETTTESPFLKELLKTIRNTHKKIAASSKADAVITENPGKTLEELVSEKKINTDQKAQLEKRPILQKQLAELESQVQQYRQFGKDYEDRFTKEKASIHEAHQIALEQAKADALAEAEANHAKQRDTDLLLLSQFLHAAAAKRQSEDAELPTGQAFEAILYLVYQGNDVSLNAFKNLIEGSSDTIVGNDGEAIDVTYEKVKELSIEAAPAVSELEGSAVDASEPEASGEPDDTAIQTVTDPTIAHAGLTEQADVLQGHPANDTSDSLPNGATDTISPPVLEHSAVGAGGNQVAEASWAPEASTPSAADEGWVNVSVARDPKETDTGFNATLAAAPATAGGENSWAEEVGEAASATQNNEDDGFARVTHHPRGGRGRGLRGSDYRGSGSRGRGDYRGDHRGRGGDRGDRRGGGFGRGRGRGDGFRGDRRGRGRGGGGGMVGGMGGGSGDQPTAA